MYQGSIKAIPTRQRSIKNPAYMWFPSGVVISPRMELPPNVGKDQKDMEYMRVAQVGRLLLIAVDTQFDTLRCQYGPSYYGLDSKI